jgi:hypothetical protein
LGYKLKNKKIKRRMKNLIDAQTAVYTEWTKAFNKQMENFVHPFKGMSTPTTPFTFNNPMFDNYLKIVNETIQYQKTVAGIVEETFSNTNLIKK